MARTAWLIGHPKDQTPYAESHKLEDVLAELKKKGQKHLVWSDGQSKPVLYDVATGEPARAEGIKAVVIVLERIEVEPGVFRHVVGVPLKSVES